MNYSKLTVNNSLPEHIALNSPVAVKTINKMPKIKYETTHKIILWMLIILIVIQAFVSFFPQKADASVPVHETARMKEGPWDMAAWSVSMFKLDLLRDIIIKWIKKGGWDGRPLFVQDFKEWFTEARDRAATLFLEELNRIADVRIGGPFREMIRTVFQNTAFSLGDAEHARYTLSPEFEAQIYGDEPATLDALLNAAIDPSNNFFGTFIQESDRLSVQKAFEAKLSDIEVNASEGFIGYRGEPGGACLIYEDWGAGPICIKFGKIRTPAGNVQNILNRVFESDLNTLEGADEIGEIIVEIINMLIFGILEFDISTGASGSYQQTGNAQLTVETFCPEVALNQIHSSLNAAQIIRYCTGTGCVVSNASPTACIIAPNGNQTCIHMGLTLGTTYTYVSFNILGNMPISPPATITCSGI